MGSSVDVGVRSNGVIDVGEFVTQVSPNVVGASVYVYVNGGNALSLVEGAGGNSVL